VAIQPASTIRTSGVVKNPNAPFRLSAQPPPFRATGRGYFNKLPYFPAGSSNANGSLLNLATGINDLQKHYLFVNSVETGWTLAGETTQTQGSRSFYPRNLSQDELIIEGMVASQYEYDKLVQFVLHHHTSQFTAVNLNNTLDGDGNYPGVIFTLFKAANAQLNTFSQMQYMVVITDVSAGAKQFQMAGIPWQLTCKVVYDYLQKQVNVETEIETTVTNAQVFGAVSNPTPSPGWVADEQAVTVSAEQTLNSDGTNSDSTNVATGT